METDAESHFDHTALLSQQFRELFRDLSKFAQKRLPVCGERLDPEDFAQECLFEYARTAERNQWSEIQKPIIWKIARQRLVDCRRRVQRRPKHQNVNLDQLAVWDRLPFDGESDSVNNSAEALFGLTAKETQQLRAKYLLGETYQKIAQREDMKPEGVRTAVRRAKRKLLASHCCGEGAGIRSAVA